jgi:hypothetical protein
MTPPLVRAALVGWLVASPASFVLNPPFWVGLFMSPGVEPADR